MMCSNDNRGRQVALFDAVVTYSIQYNVIDDTFELAYNTKKWTFALRSGTYSNIDRDDMGSIMFDFFLYCKALKNSDDMF
jgi:hypothetical protein